MPSSHKEFGLDEDAYESARRLYESSGDIRYAAIAIGKARGDRMGWPDGIPEWAIEACKKYAEVVREATPLERKKLRNRAVLPPQSPPDGLYREILDALKSGAPSFAAACRQVGIVEEGQQRSLRRKFTKDLIASGEDGAIRDQHIRLIHDAVARRRLGKRH